MQLDCCALQSSMRHLRAAYRILSVLLLGVVLFSGCSHPSSIDAPADFLPTSRIEVTFGCFDVDRSKYEKLIQQFEELHKGIQIELVALDSLPDTAPVEGRYPDDVWQRWVAAADTLAMSPDWDATKQGLLRDLTPFVQADPAFAPDDFSAGVFESLQWNGGIWGVPITIPGFHGVVFDKEAFAEANVALPRPGWTWDQFLATAQALTIKENDQGARWGYVERVWDPTPFVVGRNAAWADPTANEGQLALEHPQVIEAVRWYADLALIHKVMPVPDLDSQSATELVGRGQAAMWSDNTANLKLSDAQRQLGWVPFPVDSSTSRTTPLALDSAIMSAQATHPEAAWAWLAFLTREPPDIKALPARRSVAQERRYWDTLEAETASSYQYALQHGFFRDRALLGIGEALYQALQAIFSQRLSVETALVQAQSQAQAGGWATNARSLAAPPTTTSLRTAATSQPSARKITFSPSDFRTDPYQAAARLFHDFHPEVVVEILPLNSIISGNYLYSDALPKVAKQADCFMLPWTTWNDEVLASLLPLDPLWETDTTLEKDDFYPVALKVLRIDGTLRAMPIILYPRMMYFNRQIFDAAGLAYPSIDWTVSDFRWLVTQLAQKEELGLQYSYLPLPYLLGDAPPFIERLGGPLIDTTTVPTSYRFDIPEVLAAVQWYVSLTREGRVMPPWKRGEVDFEVWLGLLKSKQVALWSATALNLPESTFSTTTGMAPMPRGKQSITDFGLKAGFISANTKEAQACWEWLKFLTNQSILFSSSASGVPARRSLLESVEYSARVGGQTATAYRSAVSGDSRPVSASLAGGLEAEQMPIPEWFTDALQAIIDGADAATTLQKLQQKAETYSACLEIQQNLDSEARIETCTRSADLDATY